MPDVEISSLAIEVGADAGAASLELDQLASALSRLSKNSKITRTVNSLNKLKSALQGIEQSSAAVQSMRQVADAMEKLSSVQKLSGLNSALNTLAKLPSVTAGLNPEVFSSLASAIQPLSSALGQMGNIEKLSGLNSALNTLKKLPDVAKSLKETDLGDFAEQLSRVREAISPLASEMDKIGRGFAALPNNIQKAVSAGQKWNSTAQSMETSSSSLSSTVKKLAGNFSLLYIVDRVAQFLGSALADFNSYVENVNLFRVSLGDLADEATAATQEMQDVLGVDASAAMRNWGTLQNLVTSFGVASDQAYILSENMTQLGYDMASFFNIPIEDSFQKLQAAISGELEPIRRLGVDISEARLQQELFSLGINASVSSLNQGDKALLRYIAIMEQTTNAQTDMARTLNNPANQIRIFQQQITLLARSIGSLLIPALNAILPPIIAVVQVLRQAISAIAGFFGISVEFADTSTNIGSNLGGVSSGLDDVGASAGAAADAVKMLIGGFDELNVLPEPNTGSGGGGGGAGGGGSLGGIELPTYDMFEGLAEKIDAMTGKVIEALKTILPWVVGIGAAFAAWKIGNAVLSAIPAISSALSGISSVVGSVVKALTGPFSTALANVGPGVATGFSLSPLVAFAAAVGIIAGQFTNLMLNSEKFRTGLSRVFDTAKLAVSSFWESFTAALQPVGEAIQNVGDHLMDMLPPELKQGVEDFINTVKDTISRLDLNIGDVLTTLAGLALFFMPGGKIAGAAVLLFEGLTLLVRNFGGMTDEEMAKMQASVQEHWETIGNVVGSLVSGLATFVIGAFDGILTFLDGVFSLDVNMIFEGVGKIITSVFEGVFTFIEGVFGVDIPQVLEDWRQDATDKAIELGDNMRDTFNDVRNFFINKINEMWASISTWVSNSIGAVQNFVGNAINSFQTFVNNVRQFISNVWNNFRDTFNNMLNTVRNFASNALNTVQNFASGVVSAIQNAFGTVQNFFSDLISNAARWGSDLIDGFINGIQSAASRLWDAVSGIASGVSSYMHFSRPDKGPLRDYETWMPDMVAGLSRTLTASAPMLENAVQNVASRARIDAMLAPENSFYYDPPQTATTIRTQDDGSAEIVAAIRTLTAVVQQQGDARIVIGGREVFRVVKNEARRQQMRTGGPAL